MAVIKQWAKQGILFPVENIYVGHGYLGRHMMCWQHKEMWNKLKGQKGSCSWSTVEFTLFFRCVWKANWKESLEVYQTSPEASF